MSRIKYFNEIIEFNNAPEDIPGGDDLFDNLVEEPEL